MIRSTMRSALQSRGLVASRPKTAQQSWRLLSTTPAKTPSTSTFANQSKVPRLPIPDLEKSMEVYVKSLVPLLEQKVDILMEVS
jgi:hypothetical protein